MTTTRKIHPVWPIFRVEDMRRAAIYTPGRLAAVDSCCADAMERAWRNGRVPDEPAAGHLARTLLGHAKEAVEKSRILRQAPFAPECLAVSLSYRCNLSCIYCFSAGPLGGTADSPRRAGEDWLVPAARLVAENCASHGKPFHLVMQGEGEPSLDWDAVQKIVTITREVAARAGIGWFGYISTNGTLPRARAVSLAHNFTRVSLSCDGPPEIQDAQRPFPCGRGSSGSVEEAARAILSVRNRLDVRATITPATVGRQVEILHYLRNELGATHIRFEPVYRPDHGRSPEFAPDDAEHFALHFLEAQREARDAGIELSISGVRLEEVHGPYCDVLRQTLRVNSDGVAVACFRHAGTERVGASQLDIGRVDPTAGRLVLDQERIAAFRAATGEIPDGCEQCLNILHCARGCPDHCAIAGDALGEGFHCLLYKRLAAEWLGSLLKSRPTS